MSEEYESPRGEELEYEGDSPNLRYDDFIGQIVQDPNEPPSVTLLSGYLGSSSEEDHVRLYLDEELSRYVEIPQKAVRYTQELPFEHSPLGGSLLWIDRDAEVVHGAAGTERPKATFLEGQIAQDYMGTAAAFTGLSGSTQARECIGVDTRFGPKCGQSHSGPCIPPSEILNCRTLTGILCTRVGPGCRRTLFEPACTIAGPNCHTVVFYQCQQSVFYPCVTQGGPDCQVSGFGPCDPFDPTIWQGQVGQQQAFFAARPGGIGGVGGGGGGAIGTGFNCPSVFDNCATRESFCPSQANICPTDPNLCITQSFPCQTHFNSPCQSINVRCQSQSGVACPPTVLNPPCQVDTAVNCPTSDLACRTHSGPRCHVSQVAICSDTRTGPACVIGTINCPTRDLRCRISAVAFCPDTQLGCQVESIACGIDPAGGGVVQPLAANIAAGPAVALPPTRLCPSQLLICPSKVCPTLPFGCHTRDIRQCYPTFYLICNPTQFTCPTLPNSGCPGGFTQFGHCETLGGCPSAVDACPSRFGCESQAGCVSQGCFPGGGGVDPAGGGQAFAAQALQTPPTQTKSCQPGYPTVFCQTFAHCPSQFAPCQSQLVRCPSALDACPTRFNCPTLPNGCPGYTRFGACETVGPCPSAVDACPTRLGCFQTVDCGQSIACFPGGGFNPGGGF